MNSSRPVVISASRRTDIPAFYMEWFMDRLFQGFFTVTNPVSRKIKQIPADTRHIHSIVFWSKDFSALIESRAGSILNEKGYHLYFNFSINSGNPFLEPNVPSLEKRLGQLETLCSRFGPDQITWRFDPVCFYRIDGAGIKNNLNDFSSIADCASRLGIKTCVTSFVDLYPKIKRRLAFLKTERKSIPEFVDPDMSLKMDTIRHMYQILHSKNITLNLCCEQPVFNSLYQELAIKVNSCIDGRRLKELFSGDPSLKRDYGQRSGQGCRCTPSVDIGSYTDHPCFHDCIFCYAGPAMDRKIRRRT